MNFIPERLIEIRKSRGINKAEAARQLNISAMGYGRYESGEREPSYQMVSFIAQTLDCSVDYLYGISDNPTPNKLTISADKEPNLFLLVEKTRNDPDLLKRLLIYANMVSPPQ